MINKRIRDYALALQDTFLLAKLSTANVISKEAKNNTYLLIKLDNMASRQNIFPQTKYQESDTNGVVLVEIIENIDGTRSGTYIVSIFKLADRAKLFNERLD